MNLGPILSIDEQDARAIEDWKAECELAEFLGEELPEKPEPYLVSLGKSRMIDRSWQNRK